MKGRFSDSSRIFIFRQAGVVHGKIHPANGRWRALPHRVRHSPTGFEYGYEGSGPADLALSILSACVSHELADRWYQHFKHAVVSRQEKIAWSITFGEVRQFVRECEAASKEASPP